MPYYNIIKGFFKGRIALIGNCLSIGSGGNSDVGDSFSTLLNARTTDWRANGGTASFNPPSGSTIKYAELLLSTSINATSNITFTTPIETSTLIGSNFSSISGATNVRVIDVTTLVNNGGSGKYSVSSVEGNVNALLWTIFILYENPSFDYNYIYYSRGNQVINTTNLNLILTELYTPIVGPIKGYFLTSATFTDAVDKSTISINGSLIGNTSNPWNGQSPYNPQGNILPGIICVADTSSPNLGLLDTTGTFGNANSNPYTNTRPNPNRAYCDIAGFDISNTLTNNTSSQTLDLKSTVGGYFSTQLAFQINALVPIISASKYVDKAISFNGDTVTYTCVLFNSGNYTASNLCIIDTIPTGTTFINNSLSVNGTSKPGLSPSPPNGALLGYLLPNAILTITFSITITSVPRSTYVSNSYIVNYTN